MHQVVAASSTVNKGWVGVQEWVFDIRWEGTSPYARDVRFKVHFSLFGRRTVPG